MQVKFLGQEKSLGEGNGHPPQYSCLGNRMDIVAWRATADGFTKTRTHLSNWACTSMNVKAGESESCSVMSDSLQRHGLYSPWNSPGQNTGVGSLSLLPGIFPTQGSSPGFPHCRQILYQLKHKGRPRILGLVAYFFSSGSSPPRNWERVSCVAGWFFTSWAITEAHMHTHMT